MESQAPTTPKILAVTMALLAAGLYSGCAMHEELSPPAPNAAPDTRVSGQTPEPLESGFMVHLRWGGSDPDGDIAGYQFKLVPIGSDGIGRRDTLTIDPGTGAILNRWHVTAASDSVFVLMPGELSAHEKTTQAYVFLVRAVDEQGGVDPTPAYVCFTASTLLPTILVDRPAGIFGYTEAQPLPPTVRFGFTGIDPDFPSGMPTKVRYMLKRALLGDGYLRTQYEFQQYLEELCSFADSAWSDWLPYDPDPEQRVVVFPNLPMLDDMERQITYLFAVQAMDTTGAVSVDRIYGSNVQNFYISDGIAPLLSVHEPGLGTQEAVGLNNSVAYDIAAGQLFNFSWVASAEAYFGTIMAYQYGWDVIDPNDPNDPGWALPPGDSPEHFYAPERSFATGIHTLTVQCWDDSDQMTRMIYLLSVVPIPDPSMQYPLLLVDDIVDQNSNGWPAEDGLTPLDNDIYRDAFWFEVLAGPGGIEGFNAARDVIDLETQQLSFRDLVNYRVVAWTTRFTVGSFTWNNFKPLPDGSQPVNWLEQYQQQAGNVFVAGSRAMNTFLEEKRWMIPWIFDTEEEILECGAQTYYVGFGETQLPDGTIILRGTQRYPYRAMGLAMLDHATPRNNIYGLCGLGSIGNNARNAACVGTKGLALDADFAVAHPPGGAFPDTISTEATIDWRDQDPAYYEDLSTYLWGSDEFYDGNISDRATPWSPQDCGGMDCVEPMFRIHSRFDWVDVMKENNGDPDWPLSVFTVEELEERCGMYGLDGTLDNALTSGQVVGYVSHTLDAQHPSGVGDVVWGFDPYRFDHTHMKSAIQWLLGEHFGLELMP